MNKQLSMWAVLCVVGCSDEQAPAPEAPPASADIQEFDFTGSVAFNESIVRALSYECLANYAEDSGVIDLILPLNPPENTLWRVAAANQGSTSAAGKTHMVSLGSSGFIDTMNLVFDLKNVGRCIEDAYVNLEATMTSDYVAYPRLNSDAPLPGDFAGTPDPSADMQWHLEAMNIAKAHAIAYGGDPGSEDTELINRGITVGIVDQKFNFVPSGNTAGSTMFFEAGTTACDSRNYAYVQVNRGTVDHGEWVLGSAVGCDRDGQSVAAVERYANVTAVEGATGADFLVGIDIVSGVDICSGDVEPLPDLCTKPGFMERNAAGSNVINTSFMSQALYFKTTLEKAAQLQSMGIIWVAGAGNDMANGEANLYSKSAAANLSLALVPTVIGVGATQPLLQEDGAVVQDKLASFSNWGPDIDLLAPGALIYQETPPPAEAQDKKDFWNYTFVEKTGKKHAGRAAYAPPAGTWRGYANGTSFAGPIVAGVIALMARVMPTLNGAQAQYILESTADPISAEKYCGNFGKDAKKNVNGWGQNLRLRRATLEMFWGATDPGQAQQALCMSQCGASQGGGQTCTSGYINAGNAVELTQNIADWRSGGRVPENIPEAISTVALIQADTYILDADTKTARLRNIGWAEGDVVLSLPEGVTVNDVQGPNTVNLGPLPAGEDKEVTFEWAFEGTPEEPLFSRVRVGIGQADAPPQSEVSLYIQTCELPDFQSGDPGMPPCAVGQ